MDRKRKEMDTYRQVIPQSMALTQGEGETARQEEEKVLCTCVGALRGRR